MNIKAKLLGIFGGLSGGLGMLGAFGVCHTLCTALISILAIVGITTTAMPLFRPMQFLERYNWLFLGTGILSMLAALLLFYTMKKKKCPISK